MTTAFCNNDPCEAPATHRFVSDTGLTLLLCRPCAEAFMWGQASPDALVIELPIPGDKLSALMEDAELSANWRGHKLGPWVIDDNRSKAHAECIRCGHWVACKTNPMSNDIDIGGPAVAVGCGDEVK